MADEVAKWASIERKFIQDEIKWLKAGARLISPSGENITAKKLEELQGRLDHANKIVASLHPSLDVSPPK